MASNTRTALLFLLHCVLEAVAFNLDPRLPVIKQAEKGSYFGFSVAEHLVVDENRRDTVTRRVILVGAPKSQARAPLKRHSGAVYSCPLTTYRKDCKQLEVEPNGGAADKGEIRDDQWLGVTLYSQGKGGHVMTCAHRFVANGSDFQWGRGICYSLTQELDFKRQWDPCFNRPVSKAHEQYGYCQAGTSGTISEDTDIVIGTPGPYTWRGTVFTNSIRFTIRDDRSWYMGPVLDDECPVDKYSYLGMAVTTGRFFNSNMSFVAGAPRSNGTGQVVFYVKQKSPTMKVQLVLSGKQFASSFGYTLATIDLNSDGRPDLVVGAPFYFTRGEGGAAYIYMNSPEGLKPSTEPVVLTGKPESRFSFSLANAGDLNRDGYPDLAIGAPYEDSGAVYIYSGSASGIVTEPMQVLRVQDIPKIESLTKRRLTTFGYSLAGGVDLDGNGYNDLLVGAYESDTVILFRARPIIDIHTRVKGKLTNIDPSVKGCEEDPNSDQVCFSFDTCFKFNSSVLTQLRSINLKYRIEAETFTGKKYYRVKFQASSDSQRQNIVERETIIDSGSLLHERCNTEVVYLKDKSDIQSPIKFKLTYEIIQKEPQIPQEGDPLPDINRYPILNQQEASKIFDVKFLKDCGDDDVCESDLHVTAELSLPKEGRNVSVLYLGQEQVNLTIHVVNRGDPAYDAAVYITHPYSLSYIGRRILRGGQVDCQTLTGTILRCSLGNPFTNQENEELDLQIRFNPKDVREDETNLIFQVKVNTTSTELNPQEDLQLRVDIIRMAELELRGGSHPEQVFYGGNIVGESAMRYEDDIGSPVVHTYEITNHGPWRVKKAEVRVRWPYEVENGQAHGKWLLYMMEAPQVKGVKGYCQMEEGQVNPLKLKENLEFKFPIKGSEENETNKFPDEGDDEDDKDLRRRKREIVIYPEELRLDGKMVKVVTMDCDRKTAKCFDFKCHIMELDKEVTASIHIRARLWNSTFVEDYPTVDWVSIKSRASIYIDPVLDIKQHNLNDDKTEAITKAQPGFQLLQSSSEVPLWVIILSVIGGILLLVLVILCLWKLGFFKRKKPGYAPAPTHEKESEPNSYRA